MDGKMHISAQFPRLGFLKEKSLYTTLYVMPRGQHAAGRKNSTKASTARSQSTVQKTGLWLSDLKTSHLWFLQGLLIGFYHFGSVFVVVVTML